VLMCHMFLTQNNMNMKKALLILGVIAAGSSAMATVINGDINFAGDFKQNGGIQGVLSTATSMSLVPGTTQIVSADLDLAGATSPFSFATPIGVNPGTDLVGRNLWSVTVGTSTFTFLVVSETQTTTLANRIGLEGLGILSDGNPLDDTIGDWVLDFTRTGSLGNLKFGWHSTTSSEGVSVPDGGATAMLLGVGLLGFGAIRRKVA
jgi:hypothetical protein